ncbi:hypothetical protein K0504_12695 [Neiella marina]|uniref:Solute-binding protein family 3/N-terminal domain-containing protein n=1 Tax=Neiella holothuriorum TaxID=2870530 RepID=A0ABS7EHS4_9GAMM|nr:hypothetical protein [Neiella holothuriorum]MBW8191897.1 hypothetical protein [Neiella holothuriorum]
MRMKTLLGNTLLFVLLLSWSAMSFSADIVRLSSPSYGKKSTDHKLHVLKRALELTEDEFGEYQIELSHLSMKPHRALAALQGGETINVSVFAAGAKRDKQATPIRVPIRGGMLSYRLLLVNQNSLQEFQHIKTARALRRLTAGLQNDWTTTAVLKADNFNGTAVHNLKGVFEMLRSERVDYIPRAIYEIYDEYQALSQVNDAIAIEPSITLFIPMVSYVYVSPAKPRLARRLEKGLQKLSDSGELKQIFSDYYQPEFSRLKLDNRVLIKVHDDYFESQLPELSDNMLWSLESFGQAISPES